MDFNLSKEQTLIQQMVRNFTENEVKPVAAETDRNCEYPRENIEKLFRYGIMGMCVPKEYGGAGADDLSAALAVEELSKVCASTGDIVATCAATPSCATAPGLRSRSICGCSQRDTRWALLL